ncbi:PcfJ domain-containing protein [Pseudomonadota bacterium]
MAEKGRNQFLPGHMANSGVFTSANDICKYRENSVEFVSPEIELPRLLKLPHLQSHLYLKILESVSRRMANALSGQLKLIEIECGTRLQFMDQISWVADFEKKQLRQETRNSQRNWTDTGLAFRIEKEFETAYWIGLIVNPVMNEFTLRSGRSIKVTLAHWLESNLIARFQNDKWLESLRKQVFRFCQTIPGLYEVIKEAQPLMGPKRIDSTMYSEYWANSETWMELVRKSPKLVNFYSLFVEDFALPVGTNMHVVRDGCLKYGWKPSTWRFLAKYGRECYEYFYQQHIEPDLNAYNFIGFVELQRQANLEASLPRALARIVASVVQTIDIDDMPFDPRVLKVGYSKWAEEDKEGTGNSFADTEWLEVLIWMRDTRPRFDKNQWRAGWNVIWRQYQAWIQTNREACVWKSSLEEFLVGNWRIKPITDDIALANEGLIMKNCVGSYGERCKSGKYRVFAIIGNRSNYHVATVGLEKEDEWDLDQVKGKCNTNVNAEMQRMAALILRRYIGAEKQLTQNCKDINYFEVQVDKTMGKASMLWAKNSEGKWVNVAYDNYQIPSELVKKFDTYSCWFEKYANDAGARYKEHLKMRDFKRSLAFELKEILGPKYTVYLWSASANRHIALRKEGNLRLAA